MGEGNHSLHCLNRVPKLSFTLSTIKKPRTSIHKINKYGNKRSPCLMPWNIGRSQSTPPPPKKIKEDQDSRRRHTTHNQRDMVIEKVKQGQSVSNKAPPFKF